MKFFSLPGIGAANFLTAIGTNFPPSQQLELRPYAWSSKRTALSQEFIVNLHRSFHHAICGEILRHPRPACLSELLREIAVAQKSRHCFAYFRHLRSGDDQSTLAILNNFRQRPSPERNRRNLMRHRRQQGIVQCLEKRRQEEH